MTAFVPPIGQAIKQLFLSIPWDSWEPSTGCSVGGPLLGFADTNLLFIPLLQHLNASKLLSPSKVETLSPCYSS